jgi:hypothetical protein
VGVSAHASLGNQINAISVVIVGRQSVSNALSAYRGIQSGLLLLQPQLQSQRETDFHWDTNDSAVLQQWLTNGFSRNATNATLTKTERNSEI